MGFSGKHDFLGLRPVMINTRKRKFYKDIYTQNINLIKSFYLYYFPVEPKDPSPLLVFIKMRNIIF